MTLVIILVSAVFLIVSLMWNFTETHDGGGLSTVALAIFSAVFSVLFVVAVKDSSPSAMDVYRGKTTLQVLYQDSLAIDSIVVFKDTK